MSRPRIRACTFAATLAATVALLTGCGLPVSGGGFIQSAGSSGKAHFAFDLSCDANGFIVGSWVYHDKTPGPGLTSVDAHGTLTDANNDQCFKPETNSDTEDLPYVAEGQCKDDCSGIAEAVLIDGDQTGRVKNDQFGIAFGTGPYAGYSNGPLLSDGEPTPMPVLGGNLIVG
jgi:hypothetical protein